MGYFVKKLPLRKSLPAWKVQFISYKKEDTQHSTVQKPKREWDIKRKRWQALGFNEFMTLYEARARAKHQQGGDIHQNTALVSALRQEFSGRLDSLRTLTGQLEIEILSAQEAVKDARRVGPGQEERIQDLSRVVQRPFDLMKPLIVPVPNAGIAP